MEKDAINEETRHAESNNENVEASRNLYAESEQIQSASNAIERQMRSETASALPSLTITGDSSQEKRNTNGATYKSGPENAGKPRIDETEPADTQGKGGRYFGAGNRFVGMGEDHSNRHWEAYDRALDDLRNEGLTHVALEQLPRTMNDMVQDYADAKERYKNASPEERDRLTAEVQELRQRILDSYAEQTEENKLTPEQMLDMIDMAHERGVTVVGMASENERDLNQLLGAVEKNATAQNAVLTFFNANSSPEQRADARRLLEAHLTEKYDAARAAEILGWMDRMFKTGELGGMAPGSSWENFGRMGGQWRDRVFARELSQLDNKQNRVFVFAGMGHFREGEQTMRDHLASNHINMRYRRSGLALWQPRSS